MFDLHFRYFQRFPLNAEFNYHDTADPKSIYRFRIVSLGEDVTTLRIAQIFRDEGDMWLYDNEIKYGTDWGIIEFVGIHKKPNLVLIDCQYTKDDSSYKEAKD